MKMKKMLLLLYSQIFIYYLLINNVHAHDEISLTLADTKNQIPQDITIESINNDQLLIKWKTPKEINGQLSEYKIKYKIKGSSVKAETITVDASKNEYKLTNLRKNTQYSIKIGAVFNNGSGPYSEWLLETTKDNNYEPVLQKIPGEPTNLQTRLNGNSIHLTWSPPKENTAITGYSLGWGIGIPDYNRGVVEGSKRSFTIENVQPSSEYVISLRASNSLGEGKPKYATIWTQKHNKYESKYEKKPKQTQPILPPVGLKAVITSSKSATVYWTDTSLTDNDSEDDDQPIIGSDNRRYVVQYTSNIHSYNPKYQYCNTTELSCPIDNLKANTAYEFAVKVIYGRRESTWSMSVVNTTFETLPSSPPRDLTIVPSNDDSTIVHIHWQPPKIPNGQIIGYAVYYTIDNRLPDNEWSVENVNGDKMTAVIKNLLPDTIYYFKILARNNRGASPLSKEASFTTLPEIFNNSPSSSENKGLTTNTLYIIIASICLIIAFLLVIISIIICKRSCSRNNLNSKRKGYTPTATSPAAANKSKSSRELKPPDLWINHDHIELKGLDKNGDNSSMVRNTSEQKTMNYSDALYDDVNKESPIETSTSMSILVSGTSTARRQARAKPIMIPVDAQSQPIQTNNVISFEPSTGLSRPIYPISQYNIQQPQHQQQRAHVTLDNHDGMPNPHLHHHQQHLYDPVASPSLHLNLASVNNPGLMSTNISYSTGPQVTSPNSNTLNKRIIGQNPLKSFSVPSPPNTQLHSQTKHIVVRPQISTSPQKKIFPFSGKAMNSDRTQIVTPSTPHFNITESLKKEDDVMSTYSTEELNQEINNLEGLMKDLNAITASDFESNN